jgi:2-amino-4-hydroxy-6-hydroxymethyldihydropteridine diphosphokinase
MTTTLLSLGSNTDVPAKQLVKAVKHLSNLPGTTMRKASRPVQTAPWGKTDQPDFLNMAILIDTKMNVAELMENILIIELKMGRMRTEKWGPRKIDIDIILFGNAVVNTPLVTVPHPYMHERRFVLEPSAEIAPDMMHPVLQKSIAELLSVCPDHVLCTLTE